MDKRIAIIMPSMRLAGGIERVATLQANYWIQEGHKVAFWVHDGKKDTFYPLDENIEFYSLGLDTSCSLIEKIPVVKSIYKFIKGKKKLINLTKYWKPDVVISMMHGPEKYYLPCIRKMSFIIGVNHVTLALRQGVYRKSYKQRLRDRFCFVLLIHQLRKYHAVVALSKTDELNFRRLRCRTLYIPNPCSFTIGKERSVANKEKTIIMIGRLDYLKGQDRLIDIWSRIANEYADWRLLIVGNGCAKSKIYEQIHEKNLTGRIDIIEESRNVRELLEKSSIFAFTSRSESFGMVILEALSSGLPIVTYDCENGPRDLVDNYYNGFLVHEDDVETFVEKLRLLMNDPDLRKKLSENASLSAERFSLSNVMLQWEDLLIKSSFK